MNRTTIRKILVFFLIFSTFSAFGETLSIDVLNPENWIFQHRVGLFSRTGGGEYLGLADGEFVSTPETDLIIHFNDSPGPLVEGGYRVEFSDVIIQNQLRAMGTGAGLFGEQSRGLILSPGTDSMFQPGTHIGAFTIEFWLYSGAPREGGTILNWQGSSWVGTSPLFQQLSAKVTNRRLTWELDNFFIRGSQDPSDDGFQGLSVALQQRSDLIPRKWTHHMLRYNPQRNVLEYLVDGIPEALVYVTSNNRESGNPYTPYVGELSEPALTIGRQLNGLLDEFRISRQWVNTPISRGVIQEPGYIQFFRQDLLYPGARIRSLDYQAIIPGVTDVEIHWFLSDLIFTEPLSVNDPRWISAVDIPNTEKGRYLYLMAKFLPDGVDSHRPGIAELQVEYEPQAPPPPPRNVRIQEGQDGLTLTWDQVIRGNPEGYYLYFGTRPNDYFGYSSVLGASPVDLGNRTEILIQGLEPGRVYYFRVASYNYSNNPVRGSHIPMQFSPEVSARVLW